MKRECRKLQARLAGEGPSILRDNVAAQRHVESCEACFEALEALAKLDETLEAMPALDAPEKVVSDLLERVKNEPVDETRKQADTADSRWYAFLSAAVPRLSHPRPIYWVVAATAITAVFATLMIAPLMIEKEPERPSGSASFVTPPSPHRESEFSNEERTKSEAQLRRLEKLGYLQSDVPPSPPLPSSRSETMSGRRQMRLYDQPIEERERPPQDKDVGDERSGVDSGFVVPVEIPDETDDEFGFDLGVDGDEAKTVTGGVIDDRRIRAKPVRVGGFIKPPKRIKHIAPAYPPVALSAKIQGTVVLDAVIDTQGKITSVKVVRSVPLLDEAAVAAVKQWIYEPTMLNGVPVAVSMQVTVNFRPSDSPTPTPEEEPRSRKDESRIENPHGSNRAAPTDVKAARAFLAEREKTQGLSFQPAAGYWANTYVPGDPSLRLLQARLRGWNRAALQAAASAPLHLHDAARQVIQPFDPPRDAALSVFVHSDRAGLDDESRLLVQVGLQGAARSAGRRSAMSVGIVLDLGGRVPLDAAADMRALVLAFAQARDAGDRFRLVVAGKPGGLKIEPADFRHGPLMVALDDLFNEDKTSAGMASSVVDAVASAFMEVGRDDDPEAPLGSSSVVLITHRTLGRSVESLVDLAHQGAVAGIPLSVVGVGDGFSLAEIDRLALAGQGSRRVLDSRSDASRLVERELTAAGRVVARAVRLRIRLAPGVRLVDVVGSRALCASQARRVREAEQSIDLRLARNLGIASDRGRDEDGIQIVIPSFHAGDSHVILLDVVAPGPGDVADVTVHYKDLALRRNGVAQARLSMARGARAAGPLERNVLKNLLAFQLSQTFGRAGRAWSAGDGARATALLEEARDLRRGLGAVLADLAGDSEIASDMRMLDEYVHLLALGAARQSSQRALIADSLRYAGRLKLLAPPAPLFTSAL